MTIPFDLWGNFHGLRQMLPYRLGIRELGAKGSIWDDPLRWQTLKKTADELRVSQQRKVRSSGNVGWVMGHALVEQWNSDPQEVKNSD